MAGVQAPSPDLAGEITGQLLDIGYALRQRLDAEVARLGLVERRVDPEDRRVKTLVVTEAGRRMQARLHRVLAECGAILGDLDEAELRVLRDALAKVAIPQ